MLSGPFLSNYVFLFSEHHTHFKHRFLRSGKAYHLSVVHGGRADPGLVLASEEGCLETVKFFVRRGADIHTNNDSALRWASINGHLDVVKFLVQKGANVHEHNDCALRWA